MSRGIIVLPSDLKSMLLRAHQKQGCLGGFKLNGEDVLICTSVTFDDGKPRSTASKRPFNHRAMHPLHGKLVEALVHWHHVPAGSLARLSKSPSETELLEFLPLTVSDKWNFILCIESDLNAKTIAFAIRKRTERFRFRPVQVLLLDPVANALNRLPQQLTARMANKGALIVGTGSGGSEIALNLASTGIGHITLIDDDRIQPENYFRFIAGMSELGRFKIDAVRDSIIERELATSVSTFPLDIIKEADRLRGIVADFDGVLICATDSIASRRVMNCTAVLYQKPLVIAGTLDGGRIGEIMLVLPFQGPCYECVRLHFGTALEPGESDGRSPIPYLGNEDSRGGEAAGAALRSDIVVVAGLATRVALSVLDPEDFPTLSANYIAWGREECSGNPEPFNFALPFSTHYAAIPRTKDCPVCGAIPTELIGVNIEAKAADILSAVRAETP